MEKAKRILALAAVVILVGLYAAAFISAFIGGETANSIFKAALGATILVPVFAYLVLITIRMIKPAKSAVADAIIFDLGGVLLAWPWEELAEEIGLSKEAVQAIKERVMGSGIWDEYDLGTRTRAEINEDAIRAIPEFADEYLRFSEEFDRCIHKYWYTDEWLSGLRRKGYKMYFLSNWSRECADRLRENGTMKFLKVMDGGVWSYEEHILKPDREIYMRLIKKYGLNPSRCVFIDDREVNVKGAQAVGLGGIVFTDYEDVREKLGAIGVKW